MEIITTIAELDEKLDLAAEAAKRSPEQFRKCLDGFAMDPRKIAGHQPGDPRSQGYKEWQSNLYSLVAGRDYQTDSEKTPFDHDHMMRWPFPYSTRSASLVGDYLMVYGNLIKTMNLAQGARILEVGSGYGPLTYHLASMGHHVTCVDIHEPLLAYVRERTKGLPGNVVTIRADMNDLHIDDRFNAVVFFESFHHCADHVGLLGRLPELLETNGVLVLAGEPIVPKGALAVPYPWGLRMDGLSLWFIRRHGWLELGFEDEYLRTLLSELGWIVNRKTDHAAPVMGVWLARQPEGTSKNVSEFRGDEFASWNVADGAIKSHVGEFRNDRRQLGSTGKAGYLCFGPYIALESGSYEVVWEGEQVTLQSGGHVDVAADGGKSILRTAELSSTRSAGDPTPAVLARIRFNIAEQTNNVEFRMYVTSGCELLINRIVLRKSWAN